MSSIGASRRAASFCQTVRAFHAGRIDIDDTAVAAALHVAPAAARPGAGLATLLRRFGNQNFTFATSPFRDLRAIFRALAPRPDQIFCDAGAGYGHVVLYGACVAACRFRAIEILPARCAAMRRSAKRLGLHQVDVIAADALGASYDDVSYLFVDNPFFPDTAQRFIAGLKSAPGRTPMVIAVNNIVAQLRDDDDFVERDYGVDIAPYRFGIFQPAARRLTSPRRTRSAPGSGCSHSPGSGRPSRSRRGR
jgi:hypothetical protein